MRPRSATCSNDKSNTQRREDGASCKYSTSVCAVPLPAAILIAKLPMLSSPSAPAHAARMVGFKAQASSSQGGGCRVGARTRRGIHTLGDGVSLTRFSVAPPSCPTTLCVWRNLAYLTYLTRGRRAHTYDIGQHPNSGATETDAAFQVRLYQGFSGSESVREGGPLHAYTRSHSVSQTEGNAGASCSAARPAILLSVDGTAYGIELFVSHTFLTPYAFMLAGKSAPTQRSAGTPPLGTRSLPAAA